jgi:hypothetical protein
VPDVREDVSICDALGRRVQQRPRVLEVGGVEALGAPAINRCQQLLGRGTLARLAAFSVRRGARLRGYTLLSAGASQFP